MATMDARTANNYATTKSVGQIALSSAGIAQGVAIYRAVVTATVPVRFGNAVEALSLINVVINCITFLAAALLAASSPTPTASQDTENPKDPKQVQTPEAAVTRAMVAAQNHATATQAYADAAGTAAEAHQAAAAAKSAVAGVTDPNSHAEAVKGADAAAVGAQEASQKLDAARADAAKAALQASADLVTAAAAQTVGSEHTFPAASMWINYGLAFLSCVSFIFSLVIANLSPSLVANSITVSSTGSG